MLHTRWKKIFRETWSRKTRTLLVSASIFIGVMGVVTMFSIGQIVIDALVSAVDQDRLAMIRVYVSPRQDADLQDTSYLDRLNDLPEISQVQAMSIYSAYWKLPGQAEFNEAYLFGYSTPLSDVRLEPIELVEGRWPQPGQREIVVERRLASAHDIQINDPIVVRELKGARENGAARDETWTVVGTVFQPYSYSILPGAPALIPAERMIFAEHADVDAITGLAGFSIIQARYRDYATAQARATDFETAVAKEAPYVPSIRLIEDPAENYLLSQANIFNNVLSLLAFVSLLASGFLVFNVVNTVVLEQRRQIGILKSLGATGSDNFMMYAGIVLVYGVIGMIPGVLLGIPAGYLASDAITPQFNILLEGFTIAWRAVGIGVLLGLLMPVLAAAPPVLLGIRITILEAITDLGINVIYRHGVFSRLIDLLPLSISLRQALRNVSQKKGRLTLTIVALALAAGSFMGVYASFSAFDSIFFGVMDQIGIHITVGPNDKSQIDTARRLIEQNVSGIKAIEPGLTIAIDIEGYTPQKVGPGPAFMIASGLNPANPEVTKFRLRSGTGWRNDPTRSGVVIAAPIADSLHLDTGDQLTLHAGGQEATFEIIGVADYLFDTVWMRWDELAGLAGLTKGAPVPNQYFTLIQVDGSPAAAIGFDENARLGLTAVDGQFFTPGEPGVIVSAALAQQRGVAVGDQIELTSGDNRLTVPITGVFTINPPFAQPNQPDEWIGLYWHDLARLEGRSLEGEPVPGGLQIILPTARPTAREVQAKIDEINNVLIANGINANYTNWTSSTEGALQMINTARLVLNIAAAMIAAVGGIGLLSALSMSVFERQKEIGVMRSVGGTSRTIVFQFLVEGIIVGTVAWALGIPFSYALHHNLITQFNFEQAPEARYPLVALVLGLVSTLLIATFASLWPSLMAARKTVSDILRYQ